MLPARHAVIAATVFDGETALRESAVLIEGRRIVWVGPRQMLSPSRPAHVLPGDTWLVPADLGQHRIEPASGLRFLHVRTKA